MIADSGSISRADILVIGAGGAGLATALAVVQSGGRVVLVERNRTTGGTFHLSGGSFAASNSRLTALAGITDSPERHFDDVMRIGRGQANPDLVRTVVTQAGPTLDWLMDLGLQLTSAEPAYMSNRGPNAVPRSFAAKGGGSALVKVLWDALQPYVANGSCAVLLGRRLTHLLRNSAGRVEGAVLSDLAGAEQRWSAGAIVLTGGGYGGSREAVRQFNPGFENAVTMCPPHADGSVIRAAAEIGADLVHLNHVRLYPGALSWGKDPWRCPSRKFLMRLAPGLERMPLQGAIWVDTRGERLIDEDIAESEPVERLFADLPDKTIHVIFGKQARAATESCPVRAWDWVDFERVAWSGTSPQVAASWSLYDLAQKSGIDSSALVTTVKRWNRFVREGQDADFGRQPAMAIEAPPFFAISTKGCFMGTVGGIRVNSECAVLDASGTALPGLYAAGECIGAGQFMGLGGVVSGFGDVGPLVLGRVTGTRLGQASVNS